jgi:hypothetical protein
MNKRETREILAAHADRLVSSPTSGGSRRVQHEKVQGLLDLAEHLHAILVPVAPDANFRRRLHGELLLEAQSRELAPKPNLFQQHRKGFIIGAAALGSVASVLGVILAFVLRHRHDRFTNVAAG